MLEGYIAKYLRISDDDEDLGANKSESDSIVNQRKVLEYYIEHHPELSKYPVMEFLDDGFSGVNFHRPGIQKLLKEVKESRVACIVVKDLSRFGRNYIEAGDYIEQVFPFMGVRFISVSDNYDSFQKPVGIEIGFKNLIHDLYSRDLSRKVKSVKHLHQKRGCYSGGDAPYGYRRNKEEGAAYDPDPQAAQTVIKIFMLAADGIPPSRIAEILSSESIPTPGAYKNQSANENYKLKNHKSNLWTPAQVREIIQNEVYIGTYVCNKITSIKPRAMKRNDTSEYMKFEDDHEPLVEKALFQAAQNAIQVRGKRGRYKKEENPHALKGKVKCGCCGYGMIRSGKQVDSYSCHMGNACGSHMKIQTSVLEKSVLDILKKLMEASSEKERALQSTQNQILSELSKVKEEKRILEMKAGYCKTCRLNLYHQWKEGNLKKKEYFMQKEALSEQESECRQKLNLLDKKLSDVSFAKSDSIPELSGEDFSENLNLTKALADTLIERIDVYEADRIEVTWKFRDMLLC